MPPKVPANSFEPLTANEVTKVLVGKPVLISFQSPVSRGERKTPRLVPANTSVPLTAKAFSCVFGTPVGKISQVSPLSEETKKPPVVAANKSGDLIASA